MRSTWRTKRTIRRLERLYGYRSRDLRDTYKAQHTALKAVIAAKFPTRDEEKFKRAMADYRVTLPLLVEQVVWFSALCEKEGLTIHSFDEQGCVFENGLRFHFQRDA